MNLLLIALGGFAGAILRYLLTFLPGPQPTTPVRPTLVANALASLLVGLLVGLGTRLPGIYHPLALVGFLGALSTFSTLSYETWVLQSEVGFIASGRNLLANLLWGGGLLYLGLRLGQLRP